MKLRHAIRTALVLLAVASLPWPDGPRAYADPVDEGNVARHLTEASAGAASPFQSFVDLLKAGGPLAAAVLMGWFALKKDKEKDEAVKAANAQFSEIHDQMVGLVTQQTAAMVKLESTVGALSGVIASLERRLED